MSEGSPPPDVDTRLRRAISMLFNWLTESL
jgi:hypothetical protein